MNQVYGTPVYKLTKFIKLELLIEGWAAGIKSMKGYFSFLILSAHLETDGNGAFYFQRR
jgi:hypothetical protein